MNRNASLLPLAALALLACGQAAAQSPPQADATFAAWDTDRNNALSQQEFRAGWARMQQTMMANGLRAQFNGVDANRNGAIDANEYGNLFLVKRAGAAAPPLATFDANKDQRLQFEEYTRLVQRLAAPQGRAPAPAPAPPRR